MGEGVRDGMDEGSPHIEMPPAAPKKKPPLNMVVTFLLGLGVGAALCYALVDALGLNFSRNTPSEVASTADPGETAPPGETAALAEAPKPPAPQDFADIAGLWPARHLFLAIPGVELDEPTRDMLRTWKPGGVLLRPANLRDPAQTLQLVQAIKQAVGLGVSPDSVPLIAYDPEDQGPQVLGIESAPSPQSLGTLNEETIALQAGRDYGQAMRMRGLTLLIGPTLDIYEPNVSEAWLANLSFGGSPGLVAAIGLGYAEGLRLAGVLPLVKHYPGLGAAQYSTARVYSIPLTGIRELAQLMLPFSQAAEQGIPGIVVGHAAVPGLDEEYPARPASLSPVLVDAVIRETWKFDGAVISADLATHSMTRDRPFDEAFVDALAAGCDAVIASSVNADALLAAAKALREAVESTRITKDRLAHSRQRLEALNAMLHVDQPPVEPAAPADAVPQQVAEAPATAPVPAEPPAGPEGLAEKPVNVQTPEGGARIEHVVAAGESLSAIASQYDVTLADLKAWNDLDSDTIEAGRVLEIVVDGGALPEKKEAAPQGPTGTYTVQVGDTLARVANRYQTTEAELVKLNGLENANVIRVGQTLKVPQLPGGA